MLTSFLFVLAAVTPVTDQDVARARQLEQTASTLQRAGKYHDAEKPLLDAIAIWKRFPGPGDIEVLNDQMNLAVSYRRRGDAKLAVPLLEQAAAGLKASKERDAPDLHRRALNNLAAAYQETSRLDEARTTLQGVLSAIPAGAPSVERARVLDNLANVLTDAGKLDEAEEYARRGLAEWRVLKDADPVDVAISTQVLGTLLMRQKKLADARPLLRSAAETIEKALGGDHPQVASAWMLMAEVEARGGNRDAAKKLLDRALSIARKRLPENHPLVADIVAGLAALEDEPKR